MNEEDFLRMIMTERMQMHYQRFKEQHPTNPEKFQRDKQMEQAYNKLYDRLNPEDQKLLREYVNVITADVAEENEIFYQAGVRDGVNLERLVKGMKDRM